MEFTNDKGGVEFKREPGEVKAVNTLGGARIPAFAAAEVGTETKPGEYTLKVTVKDIIANKSIELIRKFKVGPKALGLVRLNVSYFAPKDTIPAPPTLLVPGQSILISCAAVNFKRDEKTKQPSVLVEILIKDKDGNPTLPEPFKDEVIKGVEEDRLAIPVALPVDLNRSGQFMVELKATDRIAKTSYTLKFPLVVLDLK
jgi:hypothetical protein